LDLASLVPNRAAGWTRRIVLLLLLLLHALQFLEQLLGCLRALIEGNYLLLLCLPTWSGIGHLGLSLIRLIFHRRSDFLRGRLVRLDNFVVYAAVGLVVRRRRLLRVHAIIRVVIGVGGADRTRAAGASGCARRENDLLNAG